ncbi:MAG: hypothetical protein O7C66_07010 [Alphaproteobacteria bacterium]|nr:hypothetical protein [Alphaproteobacteria bacterium]
MDQSLIRRLIWDKLHDPTTYGLAFFVGTLINLYGQFLLPWFRGYGNPFFIFYLEFYKQPYLTVFSVFLGYAFPFCVGIYSSVATRYKNRRVESIADFPERKPDPVFRAARNGQLVEVGAATRNFFDKHQIDCAQKILGRETWDEIVAGKRAESGTTVYFAPENVTYLMTHAATENDEINIYLSRLPS